MAKQRKDKRITLEAWQKINPELARSIENDRIFISIVDLMLSATNERLDELIPIARIALQQSFQEPITDEQLRTEIDGAAWFISDEVSYAKHVMTSRPIRVNSIS